LLVEREVNNIRGMASRGPAKVRVRRTAADRRAEIVRAATGVALGDGLDQVTLRRVAEELDVAGSLVSHYFPTVDGLLAEAFAAAAQQEREQLFAELDGLPSPLAGVGELLHRLVDAERDPISMLWMDAWHAGRRRPALGEEVARQTSRWNAQLTELVERGCAAGELVTADARATAARIMAVVDGLTVQASIRGTIDYESVEQLVFRVAEDELGLAPRTLSRRSSRPRSTGSR
jgi:AcrR family transcriptional regulator